MYPGIVMGSVLGSDMVGVISKNGTKECPVGTRVLVNPGSGWDSDERGPEGIYGILGLLPFAGTLADSLIIDHDEIVPCPEHLTTSEAAALSLAGLTAYR